jgi:hypothetical protein
VAIDRAVLAIGAATGLLSIGVFDAVLGNGKNFGVEEK